jgi:hypothetical protein
MKRVQAFYMLLFFSIVFAPSTLLADSVAFSCSWDVNGTASDATRIFVDKALVFEVDPRAQAFKAFDELDGRILGKPVILLTDTSLKLEFPMPRLAGDIAEPKVTIWVSRFDLRSSITLETSSMPRWHREGRCVRRQF